MDKKPSIKPTQLMSAVTDKTPAWILPVGSLMVSWLIKEIPYDDDIILEARGLLASRYGWKGREMDVAEAIGIRYPLHLSSQVNQIWDQYNLDMQELSEHNYYRSLYLNSPIA